MNSCWSGCSVIAMSMTTHLAFTLSRPPEGLADIDRLTPFGTVFRYDEVLPQAGQDRSQWLGWIQALRAFVESSEP